MRIVKQRLLEMLPDVRVFLDVDDLRKGKGGEMVADCHVFLIFLSGGYFASANCMRELLCAVLEGKPIVALMELDSKHGKLTRAQTREGLEEVAGKLEGWGLITEFRQRDVHTLPGPTQLYDAIFAGEPIIWDRIGAMQDVSLRLLAERLLPLSLRGMTYLQSEITRQRLLLPPLRGGRRHHLFCSAHNAGALELARALQMALVGQVCVTSDRSELAQCERVLVYLNGLTWTSGDTSSAFAAELEEAMSAGVELLLAHETAGEGGQSARHGIAFEHFFEATPQHLLTGGIYDSIAIALKDGAWRDASMAMLAQELISTHLESPSTPSPDPSGRDSAATSRWCIRMSLRPRHCTDSVSTSTMSTSSTIRRGVVGAVSATKHLRRHDSGSRFVALVEPVADADVGDAQSGNDGVRPLVTRSNSGRCLLPAMLVRSNSSNGRGSRSSLPRVAELSAAAGSTELAAVAAEPDRDARASEPSG